MTNSSTNHSPAEIRAKTAAIEELYDLGRQSLAKRVGSRKPEQHDKEADELGVESWRLAHARLFADPKRGFKKAELKRIFALFREHRFALGRLALIRLRSVPAGQRHKLAETAIRQRWTNTRLNLEIAKRFGSRKHGGRRPHIPADKEGLLAQIEGFSITWRRWYTELERDPDVREKKVDASVLPRAIRQRVEVIGEQLRELEVLAGRELGKANSDRQPRTVIQDEP